MLNRYIAKQIPLSSDKPSSLVWVTWDTVRDKRVAVTGAYLNERFAQEDANRLNEPELPPTKLRLAGSLHMIAVPI